MGKRTPTLFPSIFVRKAKPLSFFAKEVAPTFDGRSLQRYGPPWNRGIRVGRAKGNLIENLATLPWPAGVVFVVGGFFTVRRLLLKETHSDSSFPVFQKCTLIPVSFRTSPIL